MTAGKFIVLGASGGIGSETCRRLRASGSDLVIVGRDQERTSALAAELDSPFRVFDATVIDQVESCIEYGTETMSRVDGIVKVLDFFNFCHGCTDTNSRRS